MELSFKQLKKRDVINVSDGKCLGRITDLSLSFPLGTLTGITVPGKKTCFLLSFLSRSSIFISEKNILKIGGDVILVDLKCGDTCADNVSLNSPDIPDNKCGKPFPCGLLSPCKNERNDYGDL